MSEQFKILECQDCGAVIRVLTDYENQQVANNPENYIVYCSQCERDL